MMLHERLASLMDERGLTQADLARRLFVSRTTVHNWYWGITQPDYDTLRRICQLLGTDWSGLLGEVRPSGRADGDRTCRNVHEPPRNATFWPAPHFKCSKCGATYVSTDYAYYCPSCGRKVIDE